MVADPNAGVTVVWHQCWASTVDNVAVVTHVTDFCRDRAIENLRRAARDIEAGKPISLSPAERDLCLFYLRRAAQGW